MRVVIEARALQRPYTGVGRYVKNLVVALARRHVHDYTVITAQPDAAAWVATLPIARRLVPLSSPWLIPWWLNQPVRRTIRQLKPQVAHFTKAAVPTRVDCRSVVTIYDVIPLLFPQSQRRLARWYWRQALPQAAKRADHIITISQVSRDDIVRHLGVARERVTAIPLAVDQDAFRPAAAGEAVRHEAGQRAPYILWVGTLEPRKNVASLVRAFASVAREFPHRLIIAGRVYKGAAEVRRQVARLGLGERVVFTGPVSAAALYDLYRGAQVFVYPSVYEGWGLPVQEAMACGVPVIVSDGGALSEVVGEAGRVVRFTIAQLDCRLHDEDFVHALAEAIAQVLGDPALRDSLKRAGLKRVKQYSWEAVARRTEEVYQHVGQQ